MAHSIFDIKRLYYCDKMLGYKTLCTARSQFQTIFLPVYLYRTGELTLAAAWCGKVLFSAYYFYIKK